jgi:hypothetical protein
VPTILLTAIYLASSLQVKASHQTQMSVITIRIGGRSITVDSSALARWFPLLAYQYPYAPIPLDSLVADAKTRLAGHTSAPIHSDEITKALHALFEQLKWRAWGPSTTDRIVQMLEMLLRSDRSAANFLGLHNSRHRFLILCVVARCTQSAHLARALVIFFAANKRRIPEYEGPVCLREWWLGLLELRGLIHDHEVHGLMDVVKEGQMDDMVLPYYDPYPVRAAIAAPRRHVRPRLALPVLALPALAVRKSRSADHLRIGWPGYSSSAWPSPRMRPAEYPHMIGFGDDWRADEVEELKERVRRLEIKQLVL